MDSRILIINKYVSKIKFNIINYFIKNHEAVIKQPHDQFLGRNIHVNYIALACEPNEKSANDKSNFIICIDPGHQGKGDNRGEPVAPGSNNKKARVS